MKLYIKGGLIKSPKAESKKVKIYISGPITHDPDYLQRFIDVQHGLTEKGYAVINPALIGANLPDETSYSEFMQLSYTLLDMSEAVLMLDGWKESNGARLEFARAVDSKKVIFFENYG